MNRNNVSNKTMVFHIDNLADAALQSEALATAFTSFNAEKDISYLDNEAEVLLQTPRIPDLWPARPLLPAGANAAAIAIHNDGVKIWEHTHRQLIADEITLRKLQNDHGIACGAFTLFFPRASATGAYWVRFKIETLKAEADAEIVPVPCSRSFLNLQF